MQAKSKPASKEAHEGFQGFGFAEVCLSIQRGPADLNLPVTVWTFWVPLLGCKAISSNVAHLGAT